LLGLLFLFVEHIDDNADEWPIDHKNEKEELPDGDWVNVIYIKSVNSKIERNARNDIEKEEDEKYDSG